MSEAYFAGAEHGPGLSFVTACRRNRVAPKRWIDDTCRWRRIDTAGSMAWMHRLLVKQPPTSMAARAYGAVYVLTD